MRSYSSSELDTIDPLVMFIRPIGTPKEQPKPKAPAPKHDWSCATAADLLHHLAPMNFAKEKVQYEPKEEFKKSYPMKIIGGGGERYEKLQNNYLKEKATRKITVAELSLLESAAAEYPISIFEQGEGNPARRSHMMCFLERMFQGWSLDDMLEARATMKAFGTSNGASRLIKYAINTRFPVQNVTSAIEARKAILGAD